MSARYRPLTPDGVAQFIADRAVGLQLAHPVRVGLDGPLCARPGELAGAVAALLLVRSRTAVVVDSATFWRDASLRLEYGHTDVQSLVDGWLDVPALSRELLAPLGPEGDRRYLASLRDPITNRSTRASYTDASPDAVLLLHGELLLGRDLELDLAVHLALSPGARERRTPPDDQWKLAAYADYDSAVRPTETADIVVSWNDPVRPAVQLR